MKFVFGWQSLDILLIIINDQLFQMILFYSTISLCLILLSSIPVNAYDHINTPYYKVVLTNGYEDGLVGVHLKNKKQQDKAMKVQGFNFHN